MSNDFVASVIRKLNLKLMFISLAGLLVVALGLLAGARYLYNMFLGPFSIEQAEVLNLKNPDDRFQYYVNVLGDDHASTGYTYVSKSSSGSETIDAYYHALVIGDRLLLVKSKTEDIQNQVTGALTTLSTDEQKEVITELEKEMPELKGAFLAFMLDTTDFHTSGYIGLAVAALVGLLSMIGGALTLVRFATPQAHPAFKALGRFGDLESVAREIDMEMAGPHEQVGKKVHFTRGWLVSTTSSFDAARYRDILWCYKMVTQHRTNGIPTGKTYAAHICDRHGKTLVMAGKEAQVNDILTAVTRFAPGAVAGYSEELNNLWQKDRAQFAAAVDERRRNATAA